MKRRPRIDRYRLERRLAAGGMGEIYLAGVEGPGGFRRRVVLKRMLPHALASRELRERFLREARLAARFHHPNLVPVLELLDVGGELVMVLEHLEGWDLAHLFCESISRQQPFPEGVSCRIVCEAASGLDYAHELADDRGEPLQIVHRDVKPGNIFVTVEGSVRIFDFGIAKTSEEQLTSADAVQGTLAFMAPEHVRGEPVSRASDIFSLGVVLFQLLSQLPFYPRKPPRVLAAHIEGYAGCEDRMGKLPAATPERLRAILTRMLAADPGARFQTAGEVALELEAFLADTTGPVRAPDVASFVETLRSPDPSILLQDVESLQKIAPSDRFADPTVDLQPRWSTAVPDTVQLSPAGTLRRIAVAAIFLLVTASTAAATWKLTGDPPTPLPSAAPVTTSSVAPSIAPEIAEERPPAPAPRPPETAPESGELAIDCTPPAEIVHRGRSWGMTPVLRGGLAPGPITLQLTSRALGFTKRLRLRIEPGKRTVRALALQKGRLAVLVDPWADVYLAGRKIGTTPLDAIELYEGRYQLRLVNPETGRARTRSIEIAPGQLRRVQVDLR